MRIKPQPTTWQEASEIELNTIDANIPILDYHHSADMVEELSIRKTYIADLVHGGIEDTDAWRRHLAYMLMVCGNIAARKLYCLREWDMDHMLELLASKQHDYGHGNITAFGLVGVAVRMADKISRLENLTYRNDVAINEPMLDTYIDIVGYAVIAGMLINDTFRLELG